MDMEPCRREPPAPRAARCSAAAPRTGGSPVAAPMRSSRRYSPYMCVTMRRSRTAASVESRSTCCLKRCLLTVRRWGRGRRGRWRTAGETSPSFQAVGERQVQIAPVLTLGGHLAIRVLPGELVRRTTPQKDAVVRFLDDQRFTPAVFLENPSGDECPWNCRWRSVSTRERHLHSSSYSLEHHIEITTIALGHSGHASANGAVQGRACNIHGPVQQRAHP